MSENHITVIAVIRYSWDSGIDNHTFLVISLSSDMKPPPSQTTMLDRCTSYSQRSHRLQGAHLHRQGRGPLQVPHYFRIEHSVAPPPL